MRSAVAGTLLLVVSAVAAALSIAEGLPAEFGKGLLGSVALHGDRHHVARDFVAWRGTAMAAPLAILVVLAALVAFAAAGSVRAIELLGLLGLVNLIGDLGEPLTRDVLGGSRFTPGRALVIVASLVLSGLLAGLGLVEWSGSRPARDPAVPR